MKKFLGLMMVVFNPSPKKQRPDEISVYIDGKLQRLIQIEKEIKNVAIVDEKGADVRWIDVIGGKSRVVMRDVYKIVIDEIEGTNEIRIYLL
jgi:hypothetical protein